MSGSVKKNQLKTTVKIPGEQREKKCITAHEKLNLGKTDRVNKLTAAQIESLISKKQEGVCLDFTSPCFQFETSEWLNDFPNALKELDLTGQSLTEFHVEHLGKLKNLILAKNGISKMHYDGLVNLEQLVLSSNRIEHLHDMNDLKKLVNLDLSSNRITTGWTELEKLQSLRVLDLADCSIDLTIAEFYNFVLGPLKKIHKLEYVNFMGNPVEKNISEFKYFIINEMPKLKYLDWDPITKTDRQLAEKLNAEGKWADKAKAIMAKRGSLVAIARPERAERPERPVNNREKEKDPNAPGSRLSVLLKDENYSVGTLRAMEQLDAIISANLSDGDELNKLEEMLKSSNGDNRQQVDYLSLLNDMLTDDSKQANENEKADLVARGSTIDNLMAGLNVDLNIEADSQPSSSGPKSGPKSEPKAEPKPEQKSGDFLDMLTDIINEGPKGKEAPKSNGTAAKTPAKPAASQPEQKDYLALLDEMMSMSAEIETPLSPRTINHQKKSPRQAMNELEETLSSIEKTQEVKPAEKPVEVEKPAEKPVEAPVEKPVEASKPEPVAPVVAVTPPKAEMRKSTSLVDELAASIDSLEESIRRNSPSVTRKSNDSIPPVPPQPSNPKIVLTNGQGPKASPKKDGVPKVGVKAGVKAGAKKPSQSVSAEVDGELQKKLGRMRDRSESQQSLNASPSKPSELDSVLDSLAALSQQPLDKSKGPALNLSNSAATTASITDLIDSYSNKPLPSPPPKRKSNDSDSGAESPKATPKKAAAPKQPEVQVQVQEVKPEVRPKSGSVSISPQVRPDSNPLGNLLDQLIVSATTQKPKLSVVAEDTPKRPPPLSMAAVTPTSNSVQPDSNRTPLSPVDTYQIDEYLAVKSTSKSNLEHQPRYVRGMEPRSRPLWDADMNEIDIRERLGQGVFGETWMAFWSGEVGRKVTVKKLVDLDFSSAALEALRNETKKLMYLKHPNIAGVVGSGVKDAKYIMAEYIEGVSAYAYLRNPSVPIGSPFILSMARQAAAGLFYLHEQGIIHGSFKSKNVLIDRDNIVHLKDYGYLDSKDVIDRLDAQPQHLAPEVITGAAYTEKIDVYSFGLFLWEMFTKQSPFLGLTPNQVIDEIIYRQLRPEIPPTCPIVFEKLIRACWSTDPNQRPGFDKIIKILNMSEEKIFSYGDRLPTTPAPSAKTLNVSGSSSPAGPRYNKPKRLSMKVFADEEKLDPETATKLNMVLDKIIELILSNETQSQLRGVKSIETLLKTPGRLPYIARNTDVIRALIVMIDTPIPPGPLSPELEIVEVAVRVIMELAKHPSMGQPLREYRAIGAFVRLLSIEGRDGLAIMAAKAMSQFALDPENAESIKLSGALIPLVNLLHSNNEFVLIQVCSVLTALLEDEESSKNFLTAGGLERLLELLQLSNPALQLRVLDVMSNYLGNEDVQPHLATVNIKSKYLSMLNAPSPALKATGVKAMTKFAQKDIIKEESEMARVLKALIDTVTVSTDPDMLVNALKALSIFTQKLDNAVVFRNIGGLSMTFRALNNGNLDIVKSAMELFSNLLKDDVGRDALIALGSCGPLVKYLPFEDKALRLVLLNNLVQLVDKNDKGIRGLAAAAGVTPVVSVLCYSESDEEKILALKIVSNVATNPELCNDVREAGGVPVLLELLDKKSSEALLIKGAETLQLLVEQNAFNRALVLQEQGLGMLVNSLLYLPVRAQEHIVNLFGVYAREGLKNDDLLTALRGSGAIQALAQMLSLRGDEESLVVATIRLLLTLTQDEHTKGLVRDLTMVELQKLTISQNATVQNAAKKIVSLF